VVVDETGLRFEVPIASGQKTGFYLDQRESRARVRAQATGARVLDVFCYTGGFTLAALAGGARQVTAIDASAAAIERLLAQAGAQGVEPGRLDARVADAFVALRELRNRGERFDLIVLDPPKFAPTLATVPAAARAYKDVNLLALKLLAPGGRLFTYSCSGAVTADLFQKIVAGAAADAGVAVRLLARLGPAEDHPVLLSFPEGDYLKGLACGID
jgi:23S rRNA (cytosine1962-C5)-methyltransferase